MGEGTVYDVMLMLPKLLGCLFPVRWVPNSPESCARWGAPQVPRVAVLDVLHPKPLGGAVPR